MKRHRFFWIWCLIGAFVFSSCSPVLYSTIEHVTPLPEEKGELQFGLGFGSSSSESGGNGSFSFNGSYAFSDHYFAAGSFLTWDGESEPEGDDLFGLLDWGSQASLLQLGVGRYWVDKKDERWRYEVSAGYGMGFIKNGRSDDSFVDSEFGNYFIQPAIGFKSKNFWLLGSLKFNYIDFQSVDYLYQDPQEPLRLEQFLESNSQKFAIEPGINASVFLKPVIFSMKYSWSSFNSPELINGDLPIVMNRNLTLSLNFLFNSKDWK